jgi:hypothetical protein
MSPEVLSPAIQSHTVLICFSCVVVSHTAGAAALPFGSNETPQGNNMLLDTTRVRVRVPLQTGYVFPRFLAVTME